MFMGVDLKRSCTDFVENHKHMYSIKEQKMIFHQLENNESLENINPDASEFKGGSFEPPYRYKAEEPEDTEEVLPVLFPLFL